MKKIKIGKKTYNLEFGYAVVAKGGIVKKLIELQELFSGDTDTTSMDDGVETMMGCLDELLLASLQKHHSNEFGYHVRSGNGHDEALEKVDGLLDEYFKGDDADPLALIEELSSELENNGFLKHLLRQMEKATEDQGEA